MHKIQNLTKHNSFYSLFLFLVSFLFYLPNISNEFKLDALPYLEGRYLNLYNSIFDYFLMSGRHYAPFNALLNIHLFQFFGENPEPYRLLNILFLAVIAVLTFRLFSAVTHNKHLSALACFFFILHPMTAEIMNYIPMNIILCMIIFMLLSILLACRYFRHPHHKGALYASLAFQLGALFCQEFAILLPFYIAATLFFIQRQKFLDLAVKTYPYFILSFVYFVLWTVFCEGNSGVFQYFWNGSVTFPEYLSTLFVLITWYIKNFFGFTEIVFIYNHLLIRENFLPFIAGLFSLIGFSLFLILYWKDKKTTYGLILFLINLLVLFPATFAHPDMGMVIEPYWLFFGNLGLCLLLAYIFLNIKNKTLQKILLATYVFALIFFGQFYIYLGKNAFRHAEFWVNHTKNNHVAQANYAWHLAQAGKYESAYRIYFNLAEETGYKIPSIRENLKQLEGHLKGKIIAR